jgi:hypothetical protein
MRKRRRWLRWLALAGLVVLAIPFVAIEGVCHPESRAGDAVSPATTFDIADAGYLRNEANTYFTFPEWYIVYSFEDFGHFLDHGSESGFKYGRHILGFWRSFCTINRFAAGRYQSLSDVKTMIYVIGFSYPVVPVGKSRIRVQGSAAHSPEQIAFAIEKFKKVGKALGAI